MTSCSTAPCKTLTIPKRRSKSHHHIPHLPVSKTTTALRRSTNRTVFNFISCTKTPNLLDRTLVAHPLLSILATKLSWTFHNPCTVY
ncbi:hypothetical protein M3J09_002800 [Ascochyta lentis]